MSSEKEKFKSEASYDSVSCHYNCVFHDFSVRRDEWRWIEDHFFGPPHDAVLDIGCGNGALLALLATHIKLARGVDVSEGMLREARANHQKNNHISFSAIQGATLPFQDNSFDLVLSVLSFRYMDWQKIYKEMVRVLKPGGRILLIDVAKTPATLKHFGPMFIDGIRNIIYRWSHPSFSKALHAMIGSAGWKSMLRRFPMRELEEYIGFFEQSSRYEIKIISFGWKKCVFGFDSGEIKK